MIMFFIPGFLFFTWYLQKFCFQFDINPLKGF